MMAVGDQRAINVGSKGYMSLARFSPSTAPHTSKARAWVAPRLGVASRLLLAFLGISGLAVVVAGVAIFSFREIGDVLDRITARRVPAALALQEVSRQAERIVSAAPALLAAATPAVHAESSRKIAAEMHLFAKGGHGYGLRRTAASVTNWPVLAESWMRSLNVLAAK